MNLATKASRGYAMAGLLVAMSVMAVLMTVAMPAWSHMVRRENEEELIFRGTQYARAIAQYQRRFANAAPATVEVLIEQRMLRKRFKDPMSPNDDGEFQLLTAAGQAAAARSGGPPARGAAPQPGAKPAGGIIGVASKNAGESLRVYNGKTRYNEWQFMGVEQTAQPGAGRGGVPGRGTPARGVGAGTGRTSTDANKPQQRGSPPPR
jgi:type II secretory pathway pseudopilin PulG